MTQDTTSIRTVPIDAPVAGVFEVEIRLPVHVKLGSLDGCRDLHAATRLAQARARLALNEALHFPAEGIWYGVPKTISVRHDGKAVPC